MANLARSNIFHRKARSAISILAVGVGVMLFLVLVGMSEGSLREVAERMMNVDADLMVHSAGWSPVIDQSTPLDMRYKERLQGVPGVDVATPVVIWRLVILRQGQNIFGIDPEYFSRVAGYRKIVAGRELKSGFEMVLDKRLSDAGGFEVGQIIERMGHPFRIVGIAETGVPVRIFIPIQTLQEILHAEGRASFFFIKCTSAQVIPEVAAEIEERFKGLAAFPLGNYYQALSGSFWGLRVFIRSVTAVALVISFLVILLATYTSVLERTREIGILKALGATRAFILREIIAESLAIAACGVILGYALSLLAKAAVELKYPLLTVDITWTRIFLAAGLGVIGGVLGAIYPGMLAVRKDPVVALSYE
ncbi:MAG: hypothetical protein AMS15_02445 [Planctomycetes bacterium DG_23]|nr:MAG: hypothetical protein AMS15_02445 [Planctomycetes bacterium DG_23]